MLHNWINQAVSGTPGTGTITLGSAVDASFTTLSTAYSQNHLVRATIKDGLNREVGIYKFVQSTNTLERWLIEEKIESGTYSVSPGTPVSLTSSAIVSCSPASQDVTMFNKQLYIQGNYYAADALVPNSSTSTPTTNTIICQRITVGEAFLADQIALYLSTTGTGNFRLALYKENKDTGLPGALVLETAELGVGSGSGAYLGGTISQKMSPGVYYLMYWGNVATATVVRSLSGSDLPPFGFTTRFDLPGTILTKTQTYTSTTSSFTGEVGNKPTGFSGNATAANLVFVGLRAGAW